MLQFQLDDLDETERLKIVEVLERDLLLQRAQEELLS